MIPEPFIAFSSVSKRFGARVVLKALDLEIPRGQKLAIVGPSGSGKSTLLRILMTLESVEAGSVRVGDQYLWRGGREQTTKANDTTTAAIRRHVGMVFQQFNLFPHMTALQNVSAAPIKVLGKSKTRLWCRRAICWPGSGSPTRSTPIRRFYPAGSSSASPLRGHLPWIRKFCSSTR